MSKSRVVGWRRRIRSVAVATVGVMLAVAGGARGVWGQERLHYEREGFSIMRPLGWYVRSGREVAKALHERVQGALHGDWTSDPEEVVCQLVRGKSETGGAAVTVTISIRNLLPHQHSAVEFMQDIVQNVTSERPLQLLSGPEAVYLNGRYWQRTTLQRQEVGGQYTHVDLYFLTQGRKIYEVRAVIPAARAAFHADDVDEIVNSIMVD